VIQVQVLVIVLSGFVVRFNALSQALQRRGSNILDRKQLEVVPRPRGLRMQSSLRLGGAQSVQGARHQAKVASLSPTHAAGRVRKQLRCRAALAPSSSFMGTRVARSAAPQYAAMRSQTRGRTVVKAVFERFNEKVIKVRWGSDRGLQLAISAALRLSTSLCKLLSRLCLPCARLSGAGGVGVFDVQRAVQLVDSLDTACGGSGTHHIA
jgi:hypothetical protein